MHDIIHILHALTSDLLTHAIHHVIRGKNKESNIYPTDTSKKSSKPSFRHNSIALWMLSSSESASLQKFKSKIIMIST